MNLWLIFLTGLTVGGLSCLAVQGGLLASVIAAREGEEVEKKVNKKNPVVPTVVFLTAKLVVYACLGFVLGGLGGVIGISQSAQIVMQFVAGLYMIAIALNLLNVHPIFRYAVIAPPRFLTKKLRSQAKSKEIFAPAFLGAMTIFIPCGTTLAIEALAISSANPFLGAAILAAFVLGTSPVFFGVGWLTSFLGDTFRSRFLKVAAIAVIYLGITSVNGALIAWGSPISLQSMAQTIQSTLAFKPSKSEGVLTPTQTPTITILANGYEPNYIRVKKDEPVTVTLVSKKAFSCAAAFRIPALRVNMNLQPNDTKSFTFTPTEKGKIAFTCSMGMYTGVIEVI